MITRICQHCGKSYETFPSVRPKFCSSQCAGAAKKRGQEAQCAQCGKTFYRYASRPDQRFCSKSCRTTASNLTDANPAHHRDISGANNPMYGRGLNGEANPMYGKRKEQSPRWKGGRKVRRDGYILVIAPDDHPYPADTHKTGLKYILEHRLVMERHLGRYLSPDEVVHHKDGNPQNNSLDNLELFSSQAEHIRIAHGNG